MKQILSILLILYSFANNLKAQETSSRILSYSELFAEMTSSKETYRLVNATIEYNASTDQRFLEMDSVQLEPIDSIRINCKVYFDKVIFQNTPDILIVETGKYLPSISLQKIMFTDSVTFMDSKIELKSMKHCTFLSYLQFYACKFSFDFSLDNCISKGGLTFWASKLNGNLGIMNSQIYDQLNLVMVGLTGAILHINNCLLHEYSMSWTDVGRIIFDENTTKSNIEIEYNTIKTLEVYRNHFSNVSADSSRIYDALFRINNNKFETFKWFDNSYKVNNRYAGCLYLVTNTFTENFGIYNSFFPNHITLRANNIIGSFKFGHRCNFAQKAFFYETYFNERSTIDWRNLRGKIVQSDYLGLRQFPLDMDSLQSYGLLEQELGTVEYSEALIKSKRMFYNVFKTQGLSSNANEVMAEIKDLETAIWEYKYQNQNTLNAYFNWKVNEFLKKFSAYGTDPVIAIIYSLKVILLFSVFYLFFHNDWDIGGRKKIGKRLRFLLTYFQVNKGLSELDHEEQLKHEDDVALLYSENEQSRGKIPEFFTRTIRWYVQSNLISNKLRKLALKKMDILSGTFSKLPKQQQRKVAFLSAAWFSGFLFYTLLLKSLNALTLSLNAFTTLGFGNIPTKGFSRYIVIIQGFIGWVLMTIFSVTLITQLLQ